MGFFSPPRVWSQVVINELHVQPADAADPHEFVELFNSSDQTIDLSGWEIRGGIRFDFVSGTEMAPGSFIVVSENPTALEQVYAVSALGPFSGRLSNEGETVRLEAANGDVIDTVDFDLGFPWPTMAAGGGASLELVHPDLDNDHGLAWRSSGFGAALPLAENLKRLEESTADQIAPTPGRANSVRGLSWTPRVEQIRHSPRRPTSRDVSLFEVELGLNTAVEGVDLLLQIIAPGGFQPAYLPQPLPEMLETPKEPLEVNPAYASPDRWVRIPMVDTGEDGDHSQGDGVFTAQIGPFSNRSLVRYRIELRGNERDQRLTLPLSDDPGLNFTFFVYNGVPAYPTTTRTILDEGVGALHSAEVMNSIPSYHLLTRSEDLWVSHGYVRSNRIPPTNIEARRVFNWEGAVVYEGEVYDHVRYRLRQNNDRYNADWGGKRSFRFRFHRTRRFRPRDDEGQAYEVPWRSLNLSKMIDGKRNQTFGLPEAMNSWLWRLVGIPAPRTHYIQMRVIDQFEETPEGLDGQYHGDFWGVFLAFEDYDSGFVKAHDLPDGNLYKLKSSIFDGNELKRHQGEHSTPGDEDFQNIRMNLRPERDADWLHRYVDYDRWNRYHTVNEAIRHFDYLPLDRFSKNRAWFFEPVGDSPIGRLWVLPWDSDTSWGPNWGTGLDYPKQAIFEEPGKPEFKIQYRNTMREFTDLIWTREVIDTKLDALASQIQGIIRADRDRWIRAPYGPPLQYGSLEEKVKEMKAFAFEGWQPSFPGEGPVVPEGGRAAHLRRLVSDEGEGFRVPGRPLVTYAGTEGFPADGLRFLVEGLSDRQGIHTLRGYRWRLADMTYDEEDADAGRPMPLEWYALFVSQEHSLQERSLSIPTGLVEAGNRYRLRVQVVDETNRRSEWSEGFEWTATAFEKADRDALSFRVSEIHYHPLADELEYLEFVNVGEQLVWLDALSLHGGVSFRWRDRPARAVLPGERFLIVQDQEQFSRAFPHSSEQVIGEYGGQLSNGEEEFELHVDGITIQSIAYDDDWFPETDGEGASLVAQLEKGVNLNWTEKEAWIPSATKYGTPGETSQPNDRDGDGIRDAWELSRGLNPLDARDGGSILSVEGVSAYQQWLLDRCDREVSEQGVVSIVLSDETVMLAHCPRLDLELDDLNWVRSVQFQRTPQLGLAWEPLSDWLEDDGTGVSMVIARGNTSRQSFFRAVVRKQPRP